MGGDITVTIETRDEDTIPKEMLETGFAIQQLQEEHGIMVDYVSIDGSDRPCRIKMEAYKQ